MGGILPPVYYMDGNLPPVFSTTLPSLQRHVGFLGF
jgi:hypothetical protein